MTRSALLRSSMTLGILLSTMLNTGLSGTVTRPMVHAAMLPTVTITNVAIDHNSAKITFAPVAGAVDYRIYDVTDPNTVKYAGQMMYSTYSNGQRFATVNNDGVTPSYPLLLESVAAWGGWPTTSGQELGSITAPVMTIEWNKLEDHMPHTLVVQAVNQVGPMPPDNAYTVDHTNGTIVPSHLVADSMIGVNEGMTPDGKMSINGMGPSTNNPQAIAQSAPFTVQANPAIVPIPSGPEATQTYLDTFDANEASTLTLQPNPPGVSATTAYTYSLNAGQSNASDIVFRLADPTYAKPMIEDGHFMDLLAAYSPYGPTGTMALTPRVTPDISNGGMLHMSMEVDSFIDLPGRRWLGFTIAPANDPLQNRDINNASNVPLNKSDQAVFIGIGNPAHPQDVLTQEFTGPGSIGSPAVMVSALNRAQFTNMALDNRARFDLFLTQTHFALYENGGLVDRETFPTPLPYSKVSASFSHYYYHSDAEKPEEDTFGDPGPVNKLYANTIEYTDERHWANMGMEVLPSLDVPSDWSGNLGGLTARVQPVSGSAEACPAGWSCGDIGQQPSVAAGGQWTAGNALTVMAGGASSSVTDPNHGRFIAQTVNGDTSVGARLLQHPLTHSGGLAGVMMRSSLDPNAPFYAVGDESTVNWSSNTFYLHYVYRTTQGGSTTDVQTSIADPLDGSAHGPIYLKVGRQGNTFTAYTSSDGQSWTAIPGTAQTIGMPASVLGGVVDLEPTDTSWYLQNMVGIATFDTISVNGTVPPTATPTKTPTMMPMPSATATSTMMPMATNTPGATPTGVPSITSVLYDDTTGNPGSGWSDCSQTKYEHWTMTGMQGPGGMYTLHTEILSSGNYLAFCNNGLSAAQSKNLDFWVLADSGATAPGGGPGDNFSMQITTAMGKGPLVPVNSYVQGGDSQLVLSKWEHVIVPLNALGVMGTDTIKQVSFYGTGTTSYPVFYFDRMYVTGGQPSLSPTPTMVSSTPTATSTHTPPTPTATHVPATSTSVPATATRTNTPIPATATRTNTPIPPTSTATPVPPTATATATPVIPTATSTTVPVVPTATATSVGVLPTVTPTVSGVRITVGRTTLRTRVVAPGTTEVFTTTVTANRSMTHELVVFAVYNSAGKKIYQTVVRKRSFKGGVATAVSGSWVVPVREAVGTYRLAVGVLTAGWSVQAWNGRAATFSVSRMAGVSRLSHKSMRKQVQATVHPGAKNRSSQGHIVKRHRPVQ